MMRSLERACHCTLYVILKCLLSRGVAMNERGIHVAAYACDSVLVSCLYFLCSMAVLFPPTCFIPYRLLLLALIFKKPSYKFYYILLSIFISETIFNGEVINKQIKCNISRILKLLLLSFLLYISGP
ncbi:hypothetical protein SAY87_027226 [Trapa incisa]|uniref:Uncharacterized protein n=1 Tax=Trapa incisa TaxID=236973 RepID=A0AAN7GYV8_9MYRT|nr:hypothetical protein SAY87_027226 [Trapa incisa]